MVESVWTVYSCATRGETAAELDRALFWIILSDVLPIKVAAGNILGEREGAHKWFSA